MGVKAEAGNGFFFTGQCAICLQTTATSNGMKVKVRVKYTHLLW